MLLLGDRLSSLGKQVAFRGCNNGEIDMVRMSNVIRYLRGHGITRPDTFVGMVVLFGITFAMELDLVVHFGNYYVFVASG